MTVKRKANGETDRWEINDFFMKSAGAEQQRDQLLLLVEKSLLSNFRLVLSAGVVLMLDRLSVNWTDNCILFAKEKQATTVPYYVDAVKVQHN